MPSDRTDVCVVTRPVSEEHIDAFFNHIAKVNPLVQVLGAVTHWSGYGPYMAEVIPSRFNEDVPS